MPSLQGQEQITRDLRARYRPTDTYLHSLLDQSTAFQGIRFTCYYTTDANAALYVIDRLQLCRNNCSMNIGTRYENILLPDTAEGENSTYEHGGPTVETSYAKYCNKSKNLKFSLLLSRQSAYFFGQVESEQKISD